MMKRRKIISTNDILAIFMITVTSSGISCDYEPVKNTKTLIIILLSMVLLPAKLLHYPG